MQNSKADDETAVWRPHNVPWSQTAAAPQATTTRTEDCAVAPRWMEPPPFISSSTPLAVSAEEGESGPVPGIDERWTAFQTLAQSSESAFRCMHEAVVRERGEMATRQKELAAYQESQNALATQQRQHLDHLNRECAQLRQSESSAREVIAHQAERLVALESELQATRVALTQTTLTCVQSAEACEKLQEQCKAHELHASELLAGLRFADEVVRSARQTVAACEQEKNEALLMQYDRFEGYRTKLTAFYDARAMAQKDEFTTRVVELQRVMADVTAAREAQLHQDWQETASKLRAEYEEINRIAQKRRASMETEQREGKERLDRDREIMRVQLRQETDAMEHRFRGREEALLEDIAARERELRDREASVRASHAQWEEEAQRKMQARESELRTAHDAALRRMTEQFAVEREKLSENYMERLQQLSNAHMQQERELERMHREKEREMAQRYRISTVDGGERAETRERATPTADAAKEALLKRFESVEQRQRERTDKLRSAFAAQEGGKASDLP